ncbi:hypothetical protein [Winogradskya humida]|uniref:Membrane protein DUF2335 n=1 Tax=Winogradskya humida TaxID=113566 RepID=A0ABQ3ZKG3_9ACTN|nr:hypothetical protein [Actinoplanes humidus]GIE19085.1 hypothetical protein Ahu01nite_021870 [Actinoplanes humidus]
MTTTSQYFKLAVETPDEDIKRCLLTLAERDQADRMELARLAHSAARRGQIFGILAVTLCAALAGYVAFLGHPGWAAAVVLIEVAGVAGANVAGRLSRR